MLFEVESPDGRSESISVQGRMQTSGPPWAGSAQVGKYQAPPTLGDLREELFKRFSVPPFEQHLALADGEVLQGDDSNPLDAPFLKLAPARLKALPLRLSIRTDPRHAAEKMAGFIACLTSDPPKLDLALHMLRHPSGVPIDPNCKVTVNLFRDETCVYSANRATLPPLTFALWVEPKTVDVLPIVEELLARGADPNLTGDEDVSDGSGMGGARYRGTLRDVSPLCHAVQRGCAKCVRRLLEAGADPDARSGTLGPEGGLPETFLRRGFCNGHERNEILALLADARRRKLRGGRATQESAAAKSKVMVVERRGAPAQILPASVPAMPAPKPLRAAGGGWRPHAASQHAGLTIDGAAFGSRR